MASHFTFCRKIILFSIILSSLKAIALADEKPLRWSRQISNTEFINDWIPVQPRQANGRVLNFGPPAPFPSAQNNVGAPIFMNNNQPQAAAPSPTNLGEPFQRLFFQQMHPQNVPVLQNQQQLHVTNLPSTPFRMHHDLLNNGPQQFFVHHPQTHELNPQNFRFPQFNQPNKQELIQFNSNNKPEFSQFNHNHNHNHQQQKPEFIRNGESSLTAQPQPEQLVQNEPPQIKNNGIESQQPQLPVDQVQNLPPQEEVQLLYVPLDTLYHQQQDKLQNTRYNVLPSPVNPLQINNFYTHHQKFPASTVTPTTPTLKITTSAAKYRATTQKPVHRFSAFLDATESPKPKSHQPPLGMFMKNMLSFSNKPSVNDVLSNLAFARDIDVLDSISSNSPDVFIGPLGLKTPDGYTKFELPYLSSLEQTRSERQITALPFFVAPLSYRAPKGFAKIPLPQPHVGSIVVNSPNSIELQHNEKPTSFFSDGKYHPTSKQPVQYTSYSTQTPERPKGTTSRFRFGTEYSKPTYQSEPEVVSTTQGTPNNFNSIKSTASYRPHIENVYRHPTVNNNNDDEQSGFGIKHQNHHNTNNNFYATISPSKPTVEEYKYTEEPSKYLQSHQQPQIVNTTSYSYKTEEPANPFGNYFAQTSTNAYSPEPIVTTKQPESSRYEVTNIDEPIRYKSYTNPTAPPVTTTTAAHLSSASPTRDQDDIEKMKSYFREQEAFKSRQPIAISTPATYFESSTAGTISTEKGYNDFSTIPSKLSFFAKEPKTHQNVVTTPRTTVTYYTAAAASDEADNSRLKGHSVHQFRYVDSVLHNKDESNRISTTPKPEEKYVHHDALQFNEIYNTSPRYETTRTPYRLQTESQTISSIDENTATYNIPSELSPIGSNLPGLVNSLMEKDGITTPIITIPTNAPAVAVTTRRANVIRRGRPQTTPKNHQIDESVPEITTRRPNRSRRPTVNSYGNRTTTVRTSTVRSSNRFRYTPTAEDRTRQRTRARPTTTTRPIRDDKEEENIDYQRDVLKQNYPVITRTEKNFSKIPDTTIDSNKVFGYSQEPAVTPAYKFKADKEFESSSPSIQNSNVAQKYYGIKDDVAKVNVQEEPAAPTFVSTTTLASIQTDDNQEEITEVLRTRKPSFIRRVSSTTKSPPQKVVATDYESSRTKDRNSVRKF